MPIPQDLPLEPTDLQRYGKRLRWFIMTDYLTRRAPCIYVPGYDRRFECLAPSLPRDVRVVCVVQGDVPVCYEPVARLGDYLDAVVGASQHIARTLGTRHPQLGERLSVIGNGVPWPEGTGSRTTPRGELRVVYAGRLVQYQKRVLDLPRIVAAVERRGVPIRLSIVGDGSDRAGLINASRAWIASGAIRLRGTVTLDDMPALYADHDVFLLASEFEGMPLTLLEAMSAGCVPIVTDIPSGVPEVVTDGVNGFRVPVGDVRSFAERLVSLHHDRSMLATMQRAAHAAVRDLGFTADDMCDRYADLFDQLSRGPLAAGWQRPAGPPLPPPGMRVRWVDSRAPKVWRRIESFRWRVLSRGRQGMRWVGAAAPRLRRGGASEEDASQTPDA